jgi:four helix bundle protein
MSSTDERGLEGLQVWKMAVDLAAHICTQILPLLPAEEKWALTNQIRRAVQSIPANIAEGYGRYYYQESVRFCYISRGSLEETYSHLILANKLGYLSPGTLQEIEQSINNLRRLLNGYINYLKRSKRGQNEPGAGYNIHEDSLDSYLTDRDLPNP